jgi:hypothetical protein
MVKTKRTDNTMVKTKRTDNTMVKTKRTNGQTMIYKTLHRKLRIKKHESHWILGGGGANSDAPEGKSVLALLVKPVVLLDLQSRIYDIGYMLVILYTAWQYTWKLSENVINGGNRLGEWLVFNANSATFQLYHGENKLIFNDMTMWWRYRMSPFVSYLTNNVILNWRAHVSQWVW